MLNRPQCRNLSFGSGSSHGREKVSFFIRVVKLEASSSEANCWCGSTVWQGQTLMRISVSSWSTSKEDVEQSLAAMVKTAQE
jgi:hypothetical protein